MLLACDTGKPWAENEERESVMVFIGRKLPRVLFEQGLALCQAGASAAQLASAIKAGSVNAQS